MISLYFSVNSQIQYKEVKVTDGDESNAIFNCSTEKKNHIADLTRKWHPPTDKPDL